MTESNNGARPTAELPQGRVAYRELGEGEPILFVHGLLVDGRLWDGVSAQLAERFRCLVPDWPMGAHLTAMNADADLSPRGQAEIIVAFMDALGLERATIVGNDTGGAVSQMFTAAHPDRVERLILTNCDTFEHFPPFPFNGLPLIARLPGGTSVLQAPFRIGAVRRMAFAPLAKHRIDPQLVDAWLAPAAADSEIKRDLTKFLRGVRKQELIEADERLRSFERPVRFLWGSDDRFFKRSHAERLAATLPDARIADVAEARTFVPLDQPKRVAELVAEFVSEGAPAPA
jgi:pimeloyl-ACP methyl ester carboxylesterase